MRGPPLSRGRHEAQPQRGIPTTPGIFSDEEKEVLHRQLESRFR